MSNLSAATTIGAVTRPVVSAPIVTAQTRTIALLAGVALLALVAYYFIGIDEGALSVFGNSAVVHELFHDGRHFLGFPCH